MNVWLNLVLFCYVSKFMSWILSECLRTHRLKVVKVAVLSVVRVRWQLIGECALKSLGDLGHLNTSRTPADIPAVDAATSLCMTCAVICARSMLGWTIMSKVASTRSQWPMTLHRETPRRLYMKTRTIRALIRTMRCQLPLPVLSARHSQDISLDFTSYCCCTVWKEVVVVFWWVCLEYSYHSSSAKVALIYTKLVHGSVFCKLFESAPLSCVYWLCVIITCIPIQHEQQYLLHFVDRSILQVFLVLVVLCTSLILIIFQV